MEYIIVIGIIIIIILLLWKNCNKVIPSGSNDWLVILSEKDTDKIVSVEFLPVIGWRYGKSLSSRGHYEPVTPFYGNRLSYRINKFNLINYYWFRDGHEYDFTDDVRSFSRSFWEDLKSYMYNDYRLIPISNIPETFKDKYTMIIDEHKNKS